MQEIPFLKNPSGLEGSYPVNLYYEPETSCGRPALKARPGLSEYYDIDNAAGAVSNGVRALETENAKNYTTAHYLYGVCNNYVFRFSSAGGAPNIAAGSAPSTASTRVDLVLSDDHIVTCQYNQILYSTIAGWTFSAASLPGSAVPFRMTQQDTYFICTPTDSDRFYVSDANDPSTWGSDNWGQTSGYGDQLIYAKSWNRILYGFKANGIEMWRNAGTAGGVPFSRVQGATKRGIGLGQQFSVVGIGDMLYFFDTHHRVVRLNGYQIESVTPPEIQATFRGYEAENDEAFGYYIYHRGHDWYVITFTDNSATWAYDITSNFWFKLGYGASASYADMPVRNSAYFDGKMILGNDGSIAADDEVLYEFDPDATTDNGIGIYRERVFPELSSPHTNAFNRLTIHGKDHVSTDIAMGLDWSDNGQRSWETGSKQTITETGRWDYQQLGAARRRTFRMSTTTSLADQEYYAAYLDATPGIS